MFDKNRYMIDGKIERGKIAMAIKRGKIQKNDIDILISDNDVQKEFFGRGFSNKKPKTEWNKKYLNILSYDVVAEAFNPEYLYYLNEVAEYVNKIENDNIKRKNRNKKLIIGASVLIVGIAVIGMIVIKLKKDML